MATEIIAVVVTILIAVVTSVPIGRYMARVFIGERTFSILSCGRSSDWCSVPPASTRRRTRTGRATPGRCDLQRGDVARHLCGCFLQRRLPLNPDAIANMEPALSFNTISSFVTNTNLQHYSGETGLSYLSQMIVITFLQFVTAATGMAALVAVIRAIGGDRLRPSATSTWT